MLVMLAAVAVCAVTIWFLATTLWKEIDAMAAASSDTTQWALAQSEVELLSLEIAAVRALAEPAGNLDDVRVKFDIFYSRVNTLSESRQFAGLRDQEGADAHVATMQGFLDRFTPDIDGPDPLLRAALPDMLAAIAPLRSTARAFSFLAVSYFATEADQTRVRVAGQLATVAVLTLATVLALFVGVIVLIMLFRTSRRSEHEAASSRNHLQAVVATSIDAILSVDRDGRVLGYNGAAERIFGYEQSEAVGRRLSDIFGADDPGQAPGVLLGDSARTPGGLIRSEARRKDGTVFPVEYAVSPALAGDSRIVVTYLRDISDRVAAEREITEARDRAIAGEKAKADLLAVMSHEMRTPLNGLLGTMQLMQATPLVPRQKAYLKAMTTSANLLLQHVNGVLDISRTDSGKLDLTISEVNPAALVTELVESQRHAVEGSGNSIFVDCERCPERIWTDSLRLRQVILNLVGNANKFTENGTIIVECDMLRAGGMVEFRVIDSGIGIAKADHAHIFEEFRTLDATFGRKTEGTGLGLAISRRLVEALGGQIDVQSEPGQGSTFRVRLPIGAAVEGMAPGENPAEGGDPQPAVRPLDVLLVEDNEINQLVAVSMLELAGHRVTVAHDGSDAIRRADERAFEVILMDISMPVIDGVTATRTIRAGQGPNRSTPIIAVTAHALESDLQEFAAAGMNSTVTKPLLLADLTRALDRLTGSRPAGPPAEDGCDSDPVGALATLADQLGAERAQTLLTRFLSETDSLFADMGSVAADAAGRKVQAERVHRMTGSASVLGLADLVRDCRDLETRLRADLDPTASQSLARLAASWARQRPALASGLDAGI